METLENTLKAIVKADNIELLNSVVEDIPVTNGMIRKGLGTNIYIKLGPSIVEFTASSRPSPFNQLS